MREQRRSRNSPRTGLNLAAWGPHERSLGAYFVISSRRRFGGGRAEGSGPDDGEGALMLFAIARCLRLSSFFVGACPVSGDQSGPDPTVATMRATNALGFVGTPSAMTSAQPAVAGVCGSEGVETGGVTAESRAPGLPVRSITSKSPQMRRVSDHCAGRARPERHRR